MIHTFTIQGRPKPKERPRGVRRGVAAGRTYTPKSTIEAQQAIKDQYDGPWFEGPVELELVFSPKETFVVIKSMDHEDRSTLRSDLDNLVKLVGDGLQGVAFENDKQVHSITARKV